MHSHDGLTPEQEQAIRAAQIDQLIDVVGGHAARRSWARTLNTERGEGTPSSAAVDGSEDDLGFTNHADGLPPTGSGGTREIDYVFGGPQNRVVDTEFVDTDGLSDHEGQKVERGVPR